MLKKDSPSLGYFYLFMAGVLWGLGGFFITKMTDLGAHPFLTGFTGHAFPVIPLFFVNFFKGGFKSFIISKRGMFYAIVLGMITKGFFKLCYDLSIQMIGIGTASVVLYTAPVFVTLISVFAFKENLKANHYLALFLNLSGVFLMVTQGELNTLNLSAIGITVGFISAFLYALNTITAKLATATEDPLVMTFYMMFYSALFQFFFAQPWLLENIQLLMNPEFLKFSLLNGLLVGFFSNIFYFRGISTKIDMAKAPIVSSVEVIVATISGVLFFQEPLNFIGVLGIVLMLISIGQMNKKSEAEKSLSD